MHHRKSKIHTKNKKKSSFKCGVNKHICLGGHHEPSITSYMFSYVTYVYVLEGRWFNSPGLHVEVSLGKIVNPKLLLMRWLASCITITV